MATRTLSTSWAHTATRPIAAPQKLSTGVDEAIARAVTFIGPFCLGAVAWEIVQCDVAPTLAFIRDVFVWLFLKVFKQSEGKRGRSTSNDTVSTSQTQATSFASGSNTIEEYKRTSEAQGPFAFYFRLLVHILAFAARAAAAAMIGIYLTYSRGDGPSHCRSWSYLIVAMGAAAQMLMSTAVLLRSSAVLNDAAVAAIIGVCIAWTASTGLLFAVIPSWHTFSQADALCALHIENYFGIHFLSPIIFTVCLPLLFVPRGFSRKLSDAGLSLSSIKIWLGKRIRSISSESSHKQRPSDPNVLRSKLAEASFLSTQERGLAFVRTDQHAGARPMTAEELERNRKMARWHNREINALSPSNEAHTERSAVIRVVARKSTIFATWSGWWLTIILSSASGAVIAFLGLSTFLLFAIYPIIVTVNVLSCRPLLETPQHQLARTSSRDDSRSISPPQTDRSLVNSSSISSLAPPRQTLGSLQVHQSTRENPLGNPAFGKRVIHKISDCSLPEKFVNFVTLEGKPVANATASSRMTHRRSQSDCKGNQSTGYYVIGPTQLTNDESRRNSSTLANLLVPDGSRHNENRDSGNTQGSNNRSSGGTQKSRNSAPYGGSAWSSSQEFTRITPPYKDRMRSVGDAENQYTTALSPGPRKGSKRAIGFSSTDELRSTRNSKDGDPVDGDKQSRKPSVESADLEGDKSAEAATMAAQSDLSTRPRGDSASTQQDSVKSQQTVGTFGFRGSNTDAGKRTETRPRNGTYSSTVLTSQDVQEEADSIDDGTKPKIVELSSPGEKSLQAEVSGDNSLADVSHDRDDDVVLPGSLPVLEAAASHADESGEQSHASPQDEHDALPQEQRDEIPQDTLQTNIAASPQTNPTLRSPESETTYEDARSTPFSYLGVVNQGSDRHLERPLSDPTPEPDNRAEHSGDKNALRVERHRSLALGTDIESIDGVELSQYMDERGFPKGADDESDDEEPSLAAALESVDKATSLRRLSMEPYQNPGLSAPTQSSEVDGSRSDEIYSEYSRQSPSQEVGSEASFGMRDISGNPRLRNVANAAVSSPLDHKYSAGTSTKRRSFRSGSGTRLDPAMIANAPQMPLPRTPSDGSGQAVDTSSASRSPGSSSLKTSDSSDYRPGYGSRRGTASRLSLGDMSRHGSFQARLNRANSSSNVPSPLSVVSDSIKAERRNSPLSNRIVQSQEYQTAHLPDDGKAVADRSGVLGNNGARALAILSSRLSEESERQIDGNRSVDQPAHPVSSPGGRSSFDGADYALSDMLQTSSKGKAGRSRGPSMIPEQRESNEAARNAAPRREAKEDDELTSLDSREVNVASPSQDPDDSVDDDLHRISGLKEAGYLEH